MITIDDTYDLTFRRTHGEIALSSKNSKTPIYDMVANIPLDKPLLKILINRKFADDVCPKSELQKMTHDDLNLIMPYFNKDVDTLYELFKLDGINYDIHKYRLGNFNGHYNRPMYESVDYYCYITYKNALYKYIQSSEKSEKHDQHLMNLFFMRYYYVFNEKHNSFLKIVDDKNERDATINLLESLFKLFKDNKENMIGAYITNINNNVSLQNLLTMFMLERCADIAYDVFANIPNHDVFC